MTFLTEYCIYSILHSTDKPIILASIFTIILFVCQTETTRINSSTEQSDFKEETINRSIMVPDTAQEMTFLQSEVQGTETYERQNNDTQLRFENFIHKTRNHRNVSVIQTKETGIRLRLNILGPSTVTKERKVSKINNGDVGLWALVLNDKMEERDFRKRIIRPRIAEELIEEVFSDVGSVFNELLNEKGNYNISYT